MIYIHYSKSVNSPAVDSKQRSVSFGSGTQDPGYTHVMTTVLLDPLQWTVAVVPTKDGLLWSVMVALDNSPIGTLHVTVINN